MNQPEVINLYFTDLPQEIHNLILIHINTTKTICTARLVCRYWSKFWKKIPQIENTLILGYHILTPQKFSYEDLNGNIIREIRFKSYGRWCYQEYTPHKKLLRKIENKNFFTTISNDNSNDHHIKILKVDARAGLVNQTIIPKLPIGPHCCIS